MGLLTPTRYVTGVCAVDLGALAASGKRALLLDRDNTLVPRDTKVMPNEVRAWVAEARARGFKLCLVSNNWAKNVRPDADALGAELVSRAAKPLPFGLRRALRVLDVRAEEAVLIGDQLFTDVLGGNLAGIETYLVVPQTTADLAHTLVLRKFEARILGARRPEGEGAPAPAPVAEKPAPRACGIDGAQAGACPDDAAACAEPGTRA